MSTLVDYIRTHWHEVPEGVTIPDGVEFAAVWNRQDVVTHVGAGEPSTRLRRDRHAGDVTRFTPEPLPVEPTFELPTTPGALIIAHDDKDATRRLFMRAVEDGWYDFDGFYHTDEISDPQPAIVTPNGVGVLDETDKRDRVDASGDRWKWDEKTATWMLNAFIQRGTIAALDAAYGPLRFADEVSSDE